MTFLRALSYISDVVFTLLLGAGALLGHRLGAILYKQFYTRNFSDIPYGKRTGPSFKWGKILSLDNIVSQFEEEKI